jgi:D-alanine-D-alanine ligase
MINKVAVLMGGISAERKVSLNSGEQCSNALQEAGYVVNKINVTEDVNALLDALKPRPDVVFNALHGRYGEDGCIQGLLNLLRIPYTHSGVLASALAMNKYAARKIFDSQNIVTAEAILATSVEVRNGDLMPPPYVIKPINEGSSVGIHMVLEDTTYPRNFIDIPDVLLVERYIPGRELTVAVMGNCSETRPLAVTELIPSTGFYNYEAKYTDGKTKHVCPAPISPEIYKLAMEWAATAHKALGCRGITRADLRYDDSKNQLVMLEVNTQPGMTRLSLVPEQALHIGISFPELVSWMVENAQCD